MTIFTRIAAATLIAAGFGTAATAEQLGPRLVGSGNDIAIEYPMPSANVVGGALARLTGSGETTSVEVIGQTNGVQGAVGQLVGSGENVSVIYADPAPAQRLARLGQRG